MARKPPKQQRLGRRQISTVSRGRSQDVSHVAYEGLKAMVTDIGLTPAEYERQVLIAAKRAGV